MTIVFVDAAYWIAILRSDDQWHDVAVTARSKLGTVKLITTEEVLTEVLTSLSGYGSELRTQVAGMVRDILDSSEVHVVQQSHHTFLEGLSRYEQRSDKTYSLPDCISMNVMETNGITEILTSDHHFEQEGFSILMKSRR